MRPDALRNTPPPPLPVHLVGAGPGDPGLITTRGAQLLASADAVFHDELVSAAVLRMAPTARLICVGRRAGREGRDPRAAAAEMADLARGGRRVVRLKGGDPYLFGRGAEEAEALLQLGVPFEVVPGVSSALAGPAVAGIPLTHRTLASSVTIMTGHGGPNLDRWRSLATGADTLVILMAGARLAEITAALVEAGRAPGTPAAVVVAATTEQQQHAIGRLGELAAMARRLRLGTPAILVVGEVVGLSEALLSPALPALVSAV